jgi:hypothetical protein
MQVAHERQQLPQVGRKVRPQDAWPVLVSASNALSDEVFEIGVTL